MCEGDSEMCGSESLIVGNIRAKGGRNRDSFNRRGIFLLAILSREVEFLHSTLHKHQFADMSRI
jgi:hypothetical protein